MLSSSGSFVSIFGATGSIGQSTLDVISQHPDRFHVYGLTAYSQIRKLAQQAHAFNAQCVVVPSSKAKQEFLDEWALLTPSKTIPKILQGTEGLIELAQEPQSPVIMAAIVGAAGLPSVLVAAQAGKRILLANKEALVVAGELFMRAVKECGAEVLPIDSEHNAIFQCLSLRDAAQANVFRDDVKRLILTASGGPFRYTPVEQLVHVTPEQACAHPNWDMGRKISVDSATMLNKGLEVIEAHWLFNMPRSKIDVLIHPQSVVHSMVEYIDGSVVAQLGVPDMRTPIAYGLGFPERLASGVDTLNLLTCGPLEFLAPDLSRYPCLKLAFSALELGQWACISLNAANEVAVDAFLNRQLPYLSIPKVIEASIEAIDKEYSRHAYERLEDLLEIDNAARLSTKASLAKYGFEG